MNHVVKLAVLATLALAIPVAAWADIPVPGGRNKGGRPVAPRDDGDAVRAPVRVQHQPPAPNDASVDARIVIPRSVLQEVLSQPPKATWMGIPDGAAPTGGLPHFGTIVAGIALALAIASVPFVLRGRRSAAKWAAAAAVAVVILSGWTWAYGDLLPGRPGGRPARPPGNGKSILIEVSDEGETVQLWIKPQNR